MRYSPAIQEVLAFAPGDARRVSTWSNVPYFFCQALERRGIRVIPVNIGTDRILQGVYDGAWNYLRRKGITRSTHSYYRSRLHDRIGRTRIAHALRRYPNAHPLFFTFSFGTSDPARPYTLFCDMTYERRIRYFEGRPPEGRELRTVQRERRHLEGAERIVALFPELAEHLREHYSERVRYYGNVINMDQQELAIDTRPSLSGPPEIVFVGRKHYLPGLYALLEALPILNASRAVPVTLHVIGLERREIDHVLPEHVHLHGYLDKGVPQQRSTYYNILRRSRLFVNPNPQWGAFSASLEAMYLGTPVVLFPYTEFVRTFGTEDRFGHYLEENGPDHLAAVMARLLDDHSAWTSASDAAHAAVAHFTWDAYVDRFLRDEPAGA